MTRHRDSSRRTTRRARRAIADDLDDTLVVEAAAGTGKTTELVNRILRVLATGRATMVEIVAVTFTEKAAGELKLRLREELERDARRRPPTPTVAARLERRAEDARRGARQHHPRLLRRAAARAAGRSARRSAVRRADRAAGRSRSTTRAFRAWLQEALQSPPEGVRRALRRTSAPSFGGGDGDGPIDRLRSAGRTLAEWRDFPHPWRRPPFDRAARDRSRWSRRCTASPTLTAAPSSAARQPVHRHRRGPPPQPADSSSSSRSASRDLDGWEARLVDLVARPRLLAHAQGQRLQVQQGRHPHATCWRRATRCSTTCSSSGRTPTPTSPPVCSRSWPARPSAIRQLKQAAGALDFVDLLARARDLIRRNADVRAPPAAEVHAHLRRRVPGHRSDSGGDPAAAAPTIRPTIRRVRRPASSSSSAIRSRRSTASAAPTSAPTGRSAGSSRRAAAACCS